MCSPSGVPLVVSTCMRALYIIWHGRLSELGAGFALSVRAVPRGSPAVPFGFELRVDYGGHVHMNGCACSFVHASAVRMCTVPVRGLGMGCVLPTGRGVRPEFMLHFACVCMRVLYSIWRGGLGGVRSMPECYFHVCTVLVLLEQYFGVASRAVYLNCPARTRTVLVFSHYQHG